MSSIQSQNVSPFVRRAFWMLLITSVTLANGCVSSDTYQLAKQDAENARLLLQNEQQHAQGLSEANKRMKLQIEELQATLREMKENLVRTEREWRETRDELLRIKIDREQQRRGGQQRDAQPGLDTSRPLVPLPSETEASRRKAASPEEIKQRLKTVLEHLQGVLQEF
jgi:septal ring factor EnvC (AmiA/AmiB activator)